MFWNYKLIPASELKEKTKHLVLKREMELRNKLYNTVEKQKKIVARKIMKAAYSAKTSVSIYYSPKYIDVYAEIKYHLESLGYLSFLEDDLYDNQYLRVIW